MPTHLLRKLRVVHSQHFNTVLPALSGGRQGAHRAVPAPAPQPRGHVGHRGSAEPLESRLMDCWLLLLPHVLLHYPLNCVLE